MQRPVKQQDRLRWPIAAWYVDPAIHFVLGDMTRSQTGFQGRRCQALLYKKLEEAFEINVLNCLRRDLAYSHTSANIGSVRYWMSVLCPA